MHLVGLRRIAWPVAADTQRTYGHRKRVTSGPRDRPSVIARRDDTHDAARARVLDGLVGQNVERPTTKAQVEQVTAVGDRPIDCLGDGEIGRPVIGEAEDPVGAHAHPGGHATKVGPVRGDQAGHMSSVAVDIGPVRLVLAEDRVHASSNG